MKQDEQSRCEQVSRHLTEQEIVQAVDELSAFFRDTLPDSMLVATYGWGCNLHEDLCYLPMRINASRLPGFLKDSIEQRIFLPGHSDLTIGTPDNRISVFFCHEHDIHISGTEASLVCRVSSIAPYSNFQFTPHRAATAMENTPQHTESGRDELKS